jgi:heterodisulfide reductase subunit C
MQPYVMLLLLLAGWGYFFYSAYRRWNLMMVGAGENRSGRVGERVQAVIRFALAQERMRRYPLAGLAHMMIFTGFAVLLLRSLILWGRGFDADFNMWFFAAGQPLGNIYGLLKDIFIVLVFCGAAVFFYYRAIAKLPRMTLSTEGLIIVLIILVMMIFDVLYDGATMVRTARAAAESPDAVALHFHGWEPVGSAMQYAVAGVGDGGLKFLQHLGFWGHSALVLLFLNLLPYSKHFHVITAIPNVYFKDLDSPGRLPNLEDIDGMLEREETLGIKRIDQFSWKAILDFYTCTECGRCSDHCPANNTGKKLSPKHFTIDLRDFLYEHEQALVAGKRNGSNGSGEAATATEEEGTPPEHQKDLVDGVIDPEVLWACTTCRACEQECPVFISYVDKIVDMRRYLVQERGEFPNELQMAFRGLESTMNPWSFPAEDRAKWAEGLDVKRIAEHPECGVSAVGRLHARVSTSVPRR